MIENFEKIYTKHKLFSYIQRNIAEVGDFSYGHPKILHWGEDTQLKIGKFCSIAEEVKIFLGGNHRVEWISTYPFSGSGFKNIWEEAADIKGHPATKGNVIVGNDVWIGYGATIMSGVTVGNGAVIATQAIVTKNVEPYSIVAGSPARIIRKRFSDDQISKLLKIKWWDWPESKIRKNLHLLCSANIELFINKHETK
ncbi:MAG: CatB-related O-acetyltransferase [Weeksellaceae bacterium]|nr:CatB-related O-acetyltransferase [Weeksellaceae bacterium]